MKNNILKLLTLTIITLWYSIGCSQVKVSVDTTSIRIGEQVKYTIIADGDSGVVFPDSIFSEEEQNLELVRQLPIDTLENKFYKNYYITGFESGNYYIPQQKIETKGRTVLLDSILINVIPIVVDTTKQGVHPIKPIAKAPPKTWRDYSTFLWWVLTILVSLGLIYWFYGREKINKITKKEEKIYTPYEWAMKQLVKLDENTYLLNQDIKGYYTVLTDAVREFIEAEINNVAAKESTTDELILQLKAENESEDYQISLETIDLLKHILESADLVKFAKAKPIDVNIREDRAYTEKIINKLNSAIVTKKETEAEFLKSAEERDNQNVKQLKKKKLLIYGMPSLLVVICLVILMSSPNLKTRLFGTKTEQLYNQSWFTAEYGYPVIKLYAPFVLRPQPSILPKHLLSKKNVSHANFEYGKLGDDFYVNLISLEIPDKRFVNPYAAIELMTQSIKDTKSIEDFEQQTSEAKLDGKDAVLVKGGYKYKSEEYVIKAFLIVQEYTLQQLTISYRVKDKSAKMIEQKILEAINFQAINHE